MKQAITAALVVFATPAIARTCAPREDMMETLQDGYGETRQSAGLMRGVHFIEVLANIETGTWTILQTDLMGVSCIAAAGDNFERIDADPAPMGEEM